MAVNSEQQAQPTAPDRLGLCAENNMHGIQLFASYKAFGLQISVSCVN